MSDEDRRRLSSYPLKTPLVLRYGDVDQQGHLNNVAIAALYQEARLALLQQALGAALEGFSIIVVEQTIRFLEEGAYPAETVAGSGVARVGRSSYAFAHGLFQGGRCIGLCDTVLVAVGPDRRSEPLSPERRAALEALALRPAAGA